MRWLTSARTSGAATTDNEGPSNLTRFAGFEDDLAIPNGLLEVFALSSSEVAMVQASKMLTLNSLRAATLVIDHDAQLISLSTNFCQILSTNSPNIIEETTQTVAPACMLYGALPSLSSDCFPLPLTLLAILELSALFQVLFLPWAFRLELDQNIQSHISKIYQQGFTTLMIQL